MDLESRLQELELKHALMKEGLWDLTRRFCNLEYLVTTHLESGCGSCGHNITYNNGVEREVLDFNSQELYVKLLQRISLLERTAGQFYDHGDEIMDTASTSTPTNGSLNDQNIDHRIVAQCASNVVYPSSPFNPLDNQNNIGGFQIGTASTKLDYQRLAVGSYLPTVENKNEKSSSRRSRPKNKRDFKKENSTTSSNVSLDLEPQIVKIFQKPSPTPPLLNHPKPINSSVNPPVVVPSTTNVTTASKQKRGRVKCEKLCTSSKPGHACGVFHNVKDKCPPCSFNFREIKQQCGHITTSACHLKKKLMNNPCKKCSSNNNSNSNNATNKKQAATKLNSNPTKIQSNNSSSNNNNSKNNKNGSQKKDVAPPSFLNPDTQFPAQTKFTFDSKLQSNESVLTRAREITAEMNMLNCEKLSEEYVTLISTYPHLTPKLATILFEKSVIDSGPMSPRCYNKLITRIKQENDQMKGFFEKMVELTFNLFSALFSNSGTALDTSITSTKVTTAISISNSISSSMSAMFVTKFDTAATLNDKSHGILKFIGELFKTGVITCSDMKIFVEKLLARSDEAHLDYLCKLLSLCGSKLNDDIKELDASNSNLSPNSTPPQLPSKVWLKSTYEELLTHSTKPELSPSIKNSIQRVTSLQASRLASEEQQKQAKEKENLKCDEGCVETNNGRDSNIDKYSKTMIDSEGVEWELCSNSSNSADEKHVNKNQVPQNNSQPPSTNNDDTDAMMSSINAPVFSEQFMAQIYRNYMKLENQPKNSRIEWMQKRFKIYLGREILTFVREFPYFAIELKEFKELAGAAHFVEVMIAASIITKDLVIQAFISGILFNWQKYTAKKKEKLCTLLLDNLSYFVLTIFNDEKDLNWLVSLGESLHKENPKLWIALSTKVLEKKQARFKKNPNALTSVWENTGTGKEILIKQAIKLWNKM